MANLFDNLPSGASGEELTTLMAAGATRLVRIVSTGQATPEGEWLDQDNNEWVVVLRGRAGLRIAGEDAVRVLAAGGSVRLPGSRLGRS